jgi:electron transport complex protein RnfC
MNPPTLRWFSEPPGQPARPWAGELSELIDQLAAGCVCFPRASSTRLLEQLRACQRDRPDRLICSLLDGDPDLPLQAALGLRQAERIVQGMVSLQKTTGIRRAWLIADAALPDQWTLPLRKLAGDARIRCIFIRNDYPQSDPTLLLYTLLGRRLRPGNLPTDRGVLLLGGVAAWRLSDMSFAAITPIAVRDLVGNSCHYAICPLGWPLAKLLSQLGLPFAGRLIRVGDPLRDIRANVDRPIDGGEVTFHLMRPERAINPDPCVRCGWCIEGCPVRIQPAGLLEAAQRADVRLAERFGLHACIECGICS